MSDTQYSQAEVDVSIDGYFSLSAAECLGKTGDGIRMTADELKASILSSRSMRDFLDDWGLIDFERDIDVVFSLHDWATGKRESISVRDLMKASDKESTA